MAIPLRIERAEKQEVEIVDLREIINTANKPKEEVKKTLPLYREFLTYFLRFITNPFDPIASNLLRDKLEEVEKSEEKGRFFQEINEPVGIEIELGKKLTKEEIERGRKLAELYFSKGFKKGGEEMLDTAERIGNALESLSYAVEEIQPEELKEMARIIEEGDEKKIERKLKEWEDKNFEFSKAIRKLLKEKHAGIFIECAFPKSFEGIKELKVKGKNPLSMLLRLYAKILSDKKYLSLFLAIMRGKWKKLAVLLSSLDPVARYYFLKKILPLLYASGMMNKKINIIIDLLLKIAIGGRIRGNPELMRILPKLRKFLFFFGMPDGKAIEVFLRGLKWK